MLAGLLNDIRIGFTAPRLCARMMMERGLSYRDAGLIAVLALVIQYFSEKAVSWAFTGEFAPTGIPMLTAHLGLQMLQLLLMTIGAHEIGAKFGGKGTRLQAAVLSAWHLLLQAAISPVQVMAARAAVEGEATGLVLLLPLSVGLLVWIYASFIAEMHGFSRIGPSLVAVFLGFMALGVMAQLVLTSVMAAQGTLPAAEAAALAAPLPRPA